MPKSVFLKWFWFSWHVNINFRYKFPYLLRGEGTAVAQCLRCCATNRMVAGSIPAGVIEIFHWHKILPIALWPWCRVSLQEKWVPGVYPGGKGGRCVRQTTLPPSCAIVTKSGHLNFAATSGALQACNGTALLFFLLRGEFLQFNFYSIGSKSHILIRLNWNNFLVPLFHLAFCFWDFGSYRGDLDTSDSELAVIYNFVAFPWTLTGVATYERKGLNWLQLLEGCRITSSNNPTGPLRQYFERKIRFENTRNGKCINHLAPELFFFNFSTPVYKMWIIQEPNK